MRSEWVKREEMEHVLRALMPENRLACQVAMDTGLRIGDVLALKTAKLKQRMTVLEQKTGKSRKIYLKKGLYEQLLRQAGEVYVFPHRYDGKRHRTRQTVYKDVIRAAKAFRLESHVSPHSLRKMYAVEEFHRTGDAKAVQKALNHSDVSISALYFLADQLTKRKNQSKLRGTVKKDVG